MTKVSDLQFATLRAQLAGNHEEHKHLLDELDLDGRDAWPYANLVQAAFFEAVDRRFAATGTLEDVVTFVAEARSNNESAAELIQPQIAERLILHSLGKGHIDDIGDQARLQTKTYLLPLLVRDEGFDDAGLDAFMAEARSTADGWLAKDEAEGRS